ncbi:SIMPL domain-containing protein [Frigoribacterium faeni]|uniref:SIMPL domain-containing protein n=1 Tax=Frigoribacterium faeni TaxID=145483 RepID=A0A7W3PK00_9MICO|nr:SIMPL domain-containing protein [Frigoribacterium faeni]MBA8814603.1 hypothetical protein [Frigoribacterium faeni]GEK83497.1 SIMPL domain-containing protein [Frigoribacterium faeni]
MATLAVSGSVTHRHHAERGVLHLSIGFEGDDRPTVVDESMAVHNRVSDRATALRRQGAATWWSAQSVSVSLVTEPGVGDGSRASSVRYRTRSTIDVRFQDFAALTEWVGELAHVEGVSIDGIEWSLGHERRAEVERAARVAAIADAVARAADYAEALGLGTPVLAAVYEPGLRPGDGGTGAMPFGVARAAMMSTWGAGQGSTTFDLQPDDIEVTASISADFTA